VRAAAAEAERAAEESEGLEVLAALRRPDGPALEVRQTAARGRGVFAGSAVARGAAVEMAPCIAVPAAEVEHTTRTIFNECAPPPATQQPDTAPRACLPDGAPGSPRGGADLYKCRDGSMLLALGVGLGLGRIVALHHRSSTSYQIHEHIRCLYA
jgi:hypothetical protein